ncbi:MAG: hypothetical protein A2700_03060 [Candidatus Blackburnbacteria bacterium RIFCSPHIGHO2_01_FULL_44_64]|uniref:Glycerate dehydrogenase n=2 Tax=Patescibacteria group TaxID=1783273 RepID=A0A0G1KEK1_9BACT|nr:MAG: Glycerate dehydrogenase [Candidatus Azambacteria bacterium GW2011_GWA1_44_9]OGY08314.1 MAG: hypothetical protein A2700_03060 [Candidatus Blackburnbacteria bacterium RIFCSPHIGHO2_01_FULL_44_64]OGY10375.1 MAG: hypothetical protein A3D26_03635 [Candidatus Blackburnbacteria bacterium RIFCSPHIGHO2_02_FULL_44_20]OGY12114.1 MAG: hypothetical protein A3E16_00145 [Candidatus Blackburnbacteria bacterium RIFCSPHIGHO2_12_FULL_44_25]OGY13731.1 MAG: hypothetical protein A3A62_02870 [Candidatus Blackb
MKVVAVGGYIFFKKETYARLTKVSDFMHIKEEPSEKVLGDAAKQADIVVTYGKITPSFIKKYRHLKAIIVLSTGKEDLESAEMLNAASDSDTLLMYTPKYSTQSVAEYTLAALFSLQSKILLATRASFLDQSFGVLDSQRVCLTNSTVGIVGLGHIGAYVANILSKLDINTLAYTKHPDGKKLDDYRGFLTFSPTLEHLSSNSNFVVVTCSLNPETVAFLNKTSFFDHLKADVGLINTARGRIFNPDDLYKFISEKKKSCLFVDVLDFDLETNNKLRQLPNVFVTPHIAFNSLESLYNCTDVVVEDIGSILAGKPINIVK